MKKALIPAIITALVISSFQLNVLAAETGDLSSWFEKLDAYTQDLSAVSSVHDDTDNDNYTPRELYEMTAPKVVEIITYDDTGEEYARGSGFFTNDKGMIVTNYHVIEAGWAATVQTADGNQYEVQSVVGYDPYIDLAILKIDLSGNDYLELAEDEVKTGDTIYTLGSALGLTGTFSDGLVATASRVIDDVDYIQITAPISHGNSGGPLINSNGEVIGVNTWGYDDGQNINFAVNIHELAKLDISSPITLPELFSTMSSQGFLYTDDYGYDDADLEEWYEDSDQQEKEANDSFDWADTLENDSWMAGCVEGIEDFDYYAVEIDQETELSVFGITFFEEDDEYLIIACVDIDGNIVEFSEQDESDEGYIFHYLEAEIETPGTYYIIVCVSDDYPFEEPLYYQINAEW